MHVDHPHRGEVIHYSPGRQARGERPQPLTQRCVQAEGQEGNKDMCLDPGFALVEHRPDRQIAFEGLERLLNLDQPDVIIPQLRGIVLW